MLDSETKRRIDTARDILVGKVPDPKSQVEQITIALIYKFMDDMDAEAEEMGGTRSFFASDYEQYGWSKLMAPNMGGFDVLTLYSEAIQKMNFNPGIPQLFRDIFKNAYLPYRDPETLKGFLKVIDDFEYDHSERLGDAFEYLLSVLGSQGEAGQFRTPRHIIDFMAEIIDPKKTDTIIDPACGTAGFLISSYKHILKHNSTNYDPKQDRKTYENGHAPAAERVVNGTFYRGDRLTPDDRARLAGNIIGYDISPDMVRLSLVNMYLHSFTDPHIVEYDTLTSEDRWNEFGDVILANPPFMSPKGGIKPHKRFSVQSKRSEVLFVDYIAEHLSPTGRAAVIVPEGIIFQSGTAYKQLRKMLIENYLFGVVSLPGGVFNPYSGVKTSILLMDKTLAKKIDNIIFVKIENDGFDLGAQRRPKKGSHLPQAVKYLKDYIQCVRSGKEFVAENIPNLLVVEKEKIGENGDWNLSGERYRKVTISKSSYPLVPVGSFYRAQVKSIDPRLSPEDNFELWSIPACDKGSPEILKGAEIGSQKKIVYPGDVLLSRIIPHIRRAWAVQENPNGYCQVASTEWVVFSSTEVVPEFLRRALISDVFHERFMQTITGIGGSLSRANPKAVADIQIPLPPLEIQKEIVAEIESYQKIIDGARAVVENYKPQIQIDPEWPIVALGDIATVASSKRIFQDDYVPNGIPFYRTKEIVELSQGNDISLELFISDEKYNSIKEKFDVPKNGEILVSAVGTIGISWVISDDRKFYFKDGNLLWIKGFDKVLPDYLKHVLDDIFLNNMEKYIFGAAYKALTIITLKQFEIPLPTIETQNQIVAQIEKEQELINGNKELIQIFEQKIKDKIASVWGD